MSPLDKKITILIILLLGGILGLLGWEDHIKTPIFSDQTVYYIGTESTEAGRLLAYDPTTQQKHFLTKEGLIVNEYLLDKDAKGVSTIYYLAVPEQYFLGPQQIQAHQSFSSLVLGAGKRRAIEIPKDTGLSKLYPAIINDQIFFEGPQNIWSYSLRTKKWSPFHQNISLQDIQLSQPSQLMLAANPLENFGYTLLSLAEGDLGSPIGNYYQNFGFSPDGTKFLLRQKPNQDIFSDQSFLVVFSADGTSKDILTDYGDIVQAVWKDNETVLVVVRDQDFTESIIEVNIHNPEDIVELVDAWSVQWIGYANNHLWIVTEEEIGIIDYEKTEGMQDLLDAFSELQKEYAIWSYDFTSESLTQWPIEGFFPRQF